MTRIRTPIPPLSEPRLRKERDADLGLQLRQADGLAKR
jgi:hypothetical protein